MSEEPAPRADVDEFLPLQHLAFHVLLAVAEGPRYGYDVGREVEERSGGRIRPSIGSLYLAIQRLQKQGLIEESPERPDPPDDDARRRYYRATELGRRVAEAEAERLAALVTLARERHLLERGR